MVSLLCVRPVRFRAGRTGGTHGIYYRELKLHGQIIQQHLRSGQILPPGLDGRRNARYYWAPWYVLLLYSSPMDLLTGTISRACPLFVSDPVDHEEPVKDTVDQKHHGRRRQLIYLKRAATSYRPKDVECDGGGHRIGSLRQCCCCVIPSWSLPGMFDSCACVHRVGSTVDEMERDQPMGMAIEQTIYGRRNQPATRSHTPAGVEDVTGATIGLPRTG